MATTEHIDSDELYLRQGRFGTANLVKRPHDGFVGNVHFNVPIHKHPIGEVIQVPCDGVIGVPGHSELVYLKTSTNLNAKDLCTPDALAPWYSFAFSDGSVVDERAVIAISAMKPGCYGWFWCGGVCPETQLLKLGGEYQRSTALDSINLR